MSATELKINGSNKSQCQKILELLKARHGRFVPEPRLLRASGSHAVHSRIADLHRAGYNIVNETTQAGRKKHSRYMLV